MGICDRSDAYKLCFLVCARLEVRTRPTSLTEPPDASKCNRTHHQLMEQLNVGHIIHSYLVFIRKQKDLHHLQSLRYVVAVHVEATWESGDVVRKSSTTTKNKGFDGGGAAGVYSCQA